MQNSRPMVAWEDSPSTDIAGVRRSSTPDPETYRNMRKPARRPVEREKEEYDVNMAEIDARLNALQQYMQELGAAK